MQKIKVREVEYDILGNFVGFSYGWALGGRYRYEEKKHDKK